MNSPPSSFRRPATASHSPHGSSKQRQADLPHLHAFTRGLDFDRNALNAGLTLPDHNGGNRRSEHQTK